MPLFKRAIEIDPKFAMAHASLGFYLWPDGRVRPSPRESNSKAYQLRDRASDREKFFITATYDLQVTGNLEKAQQTCELWCAPILATRDAATGCWAPWSTRPSASTKRALEAARQSIELDPDFPIGYLQLAFNDQFLGDLDEAEPRRFSGRPTANWRSLNFCSSDTTSPS